MRAVFPVSHMSTQLTLFDRGADGICTLTINRPEKMNALNTALIDELEQVLNMCSTDAGVRGLIVTGSGQKAFVAGADIGELATGSGIRAMDLARKGQRVYRLLETMGKPSVAAVNGFALGGGLEFAMACTVRVASPNARMGQPEVKLGIIAGYGGTQRLPALVGRGRALELLLTGDMIDAEEARRIGLVNHVVPQEQLLDFSHTLLTKVLANGPLAIRLTMAAVDTGLACGIEEGLRFEAAAFGVAASTADCVEGTRAFLEKRPARFTGK